MNQVTVSVPLSGDIFSRICGSFDCNIKKVDKTFGVSSVYRNDELKVSGSEADARQALYVFRQLMALSQKGTDIAEQQLDYAIDLSREKSNLSISDVGDDIIAHTTTGKPISARTFGQQDYVNQMREKMIVFGVGPAGTGKTYLAMAMAITAFKNEEVGRIILTRPAIEAGEKLGFLPGDLQSKVDPYLRPLYDALYQIMGADAFARNMEKGLIEVAPLAYMRGRTLDNAYIILDEAQNTTPAQMKMFLTRIGFGSKVVITGDQTQIDLAPGVKSGLKDALNVLKGIDDIGICTLTSKDVVRHPLVQKIVKAYEKNENKRKKSSGEKAGFRKK
ncbi:MAG: PhoH family protein [Eubacterium sp.]|nr:PhoH family protein [Eubacterium sp.]